MVRFPFNRGNQQELLLLGCEQYSQQPLNKYFTVNLHQCHPIISLCTPTVELKKTTHCPTLHVSTSQSGVHVTLRKLDGKETIWMDYLYHRVTVNSIALSRANRMPNITAPSPRNTEHSGIHLQEWLSLKVRQSGYLPQHYGTGREEDNPPALDDIRSFTDLMWVSLVCPPASIKVSERRGGEAFWAVCVGGWRSLAFLRTCQHLLPPDSNRIQTRPALEMASGAVWGLCSLCSLEAGSLKSEVNLRLSN